MSYADLINLKPAYGAGVPLGHDFADEDDWHIVLEVALPFSDSALLGTMELGTDVLSSIAMWTDITSDLEFGEISTGGEDRPDIANLFVRLRDTNRDYAPWNSTYYGPGTYIRVGVGCGENDGLIRDYYPQYTGVIRTWNTAKDHAYKWVEGNCADPMFLLANVNDKALGSVEGSGDTVIDRLERLIAAAGLDIPVNDVGIENPFETYEYQSTDMADNRLAEMYAVVDSIDATMWLDGQGKIRVFMPAGNFDEGFVFNDTHPIVRDSLVTSNDDELIISKALLAHAGGTQEEYENTALTNRYAKRTYVNNNVMLRDIYSDVDLENLAERILLKSETTYKPESFELDINHGVGEAMLTQLKVGTCVSVKDEVLFKNFPISRMTHTFAPAGGRWYWKTLVELGVDVVSTMEYLSE